jgi:hypothetical protein
VKFYFSKLCRHISLSGNTRPKTTDISREDLCTLVRLSRPFAKHLQKKTYAKIVEEVPLTIKDKVALRWRMYRVLVENAVRPKKTYFKSAFRIPSLIIAYKNFRHNENNEAKTGR